jgi:hypothetical protein
MSPCGLEWSFGRESDEHPVLELGPDSMGVTGRVDRIDVEPGGGALVRDYKNRTVHAGARWAGDGRLQVALYALAARELLGLQPVGAVYQPLGGPDLRPRGLVCEGGEGTWVTNDVVDEDAFDCALEDARATAQRAAEELRAGGSLRARSDARPRDAPIPRSAGQWNDPRGSCAPGVRGPRVHARAADGDQRSRRLAPAGGQRRLGQDRGHGRAVRRGGPP